MSPLCVRVHAPFAAYRPLQAGSLRTTLPVMPYSAAWGLVLNLAGIETRQGIDDVTTSTNPAAPPLCLALGLPGTAPEVATVYQQLHSYPVGNSGKKLRGRTHGAKYWIAPLRRELLVGLDMVLAVEGEPTVLGRVCDALAGRSTWKRYGLPFAGDNNLLFDRIERLASPVECYWYTRVDPEGPVRVNTTRLHCAIDRQDSSRTRFELVAPADSPSATPPESAWVWTPHELPS